MKIPSLLLLSVVSLQMGCNACTSKPVTPKPAEPTPPGPANNNVIPSKSTVTAVFFTAKDKTMFWMESTGSTYGAPPEKSYWTDQGVIVPQNDGWHTYLADGSNFATAVAPDPAAGLISIKDVLLKETTAPEGYTWESEASAGPIRIFINPAMGKRQRIGAYPEPPSAPVWMEAKRPEARGAEVPMLSKSSGFQLREDSKGRVHTVGIVETRCRDLDELQGHIQLGEATRVKALSSSKQLSSHDPEGGYNRVRHSPPNIPCSSLWDTSDHI